MAWQLAVRQMLNVVVKDVRAGADNALLAASKTLQRFGTCARFPSIVLISFPDEQRVQAMLFFFFWFFSS